MVAENTTAGLQAEVHRLLVGIFFRPVIGGVCAALGGDQRRGKAREPASPRLYRRGEAGYDRGAQAEGRVRRRGAAAAKRLSAGEGEERNAAGG